MLSCSLIHTREMREGGLPTLHLALRRLLRNLFQPTPFLHHLVAFDDFIDITDRSDFRRLIAASFGCPSLAAPEINSAAAGPPRFRCQPFARELALDPGGATPSRIATAHVQPSLRSTNSAPATFLNFVAQSQSSRDLCLRFRPCVTAPPARLDTSLSATTLAGRDSHPLVSISFSWRTLRCSPPLSSASVFRPR